ncbi:MAG: sugar phosphate isomerase/epimerase family protein [Candidatus Brocadiia bacterium]
MYVSVRDCMLASTGVSDPVAALREVGVNSTEVAVGKDATVATFTGEDESLELGSDEDLSALGSVLQENDLSICAFLMGNDFSSDEYDQEVDALVTTCQAAETLGVPAVRIDLIPRQGDMPEDEFITRCLEATDQALGACADVDLGIENHGGTSNRPEFLDKVFERSSSERLGLTLDTGNFYWFGHPLEMVYELMEKYGPRINHTHCKNIAYPEDIQNERREVGYEYGEYVAPIYEGDIDHKRVVSILSQAGYDRSLCVEDESLGHFPDDERAEVLQKDVDYLKSIV